MPSADGTLRGMRVPYEPMTVPKASREIRRLLEAGDERNAMRGGLPVD